MKEALEQKIMAKERQIKRLQLDLDYYKGKLKRLSFDEYEIEDYVITVAKEMKEAKDEIRQLQYEVYELMQILKA